MDTNTVLVEKKKKKKKKKTELFFLLLPQILMKLQCFRHIDKVLIYTIYLFFDYF